MRERDKPVLLDEWEHGSTKYRLISQGYDRTLTVERLVRLNAMGQPTWETVVRAFPKSRSREGRATISELLVARIAEILEEPARAALAASPPTATTIPYVIDEWGQPPTRYRIVQSSDALTLERCDRQDAMGDPIWNGLADVRPAGSRIEEEDDGVDPTVKMLMKKIAQAVEGKRTK